LTASILASPSSADPGVSSLITADGLTLTTRVWSHPAPRAVVVLVHGFAASAQDPAVVRQAKDLHAAGFEVLCYDARGHGASDGMCTLGDLECNDVAAAVAAVGSPGPIVVIGASMGAVAALRFATTCGPSDTSTPAVAGVVAISCPSAWRLPRTPTGLLSAVLTRTPFGRMVAARHLRVRVADEWTAAEPPLALASRLTVPVAIIHGQRDRFIPPTAALELYEACGGPRRLELVRDMGHAFDPAGLGAVRSAVDWVLARGAVQPARPAVGIGGRG
jgi:alpha-beta hydrolase superfamily lysophospholipase